MNSCKTKKALQFLIFIFPCYFIIAFIGYCLTQGAELWSEPAFVPLAGIVIASIITGVFLVKRQYWFSVFMIALGVYFVCAGKNHAFIFEVVMLYGAYLIAHFSLCALYVFRNRNK